MEDSPARRSGFLTRLKEGLRVGGRAAEEPPWTFRAPLHAYGKLPIYKDFISVGLTEPGAREFRAWLDRGFSHRWAADEAYRETEIPRHMFLLRLPESGASVAGCLWGSRDQGGLRRFPFTIFVTLAEGHRAADPLAATEYLPLLERRSDAVARDFGPGGSLADFYRAFRGTEFDLPVKLRERIRREARGDLEQVSISSFAAALFGEEAPGRWPALLAGLEAISTEPRGDVARAVRIALSGGLSRARQLQFWLLWLSRSGSHRNRVSGLLYASGTAPGRAVLLFRDLRPEDIFLLHPTRTDYPYAEDLSAALASSGVLPPQSGGAPALDGWDRPLASMLEA
ncbi:MAG: type VI secretion system-associated protein TagF [Thermoanaerobaculia bacterium]